jgi:hypothetical protein
MGDDTYEQSFCNGCEHNSQAVHDGEQGQCMPQSFLHTFMVTPKEWKGGECSSFEAIEESEVK